MDTSQADIVDGKQQGRKTAESRIRERVEESLNEFRREVIERPFLYLVIAFVAGFVSQSFPVRLVSSALLRLISLLSGPAVLTLGILKICELFSAEREPRAS
jgi:hypothetical protein